MRDERYPLWEEPDHQNGGTWRFKCRKSDTVSSCCLIMLIILDYFSKKLEFLQETVWKEVVLAAIGEQFSESLDEDDEVFGVTVSIRDVDDLIQVIEIFFDICIFCTRNC